MNEQSITAQMFDDLGAIHTPTPLEELRSGRVTPEKMKQIRDWLAQNKADEAQKSAEDSIYKKQVAQTAEANYGTT